MTLLLFRVVTCSQVRERWSLRLTGGLVQPYQCCGEERVEK